MKPGAMVLMRISGPRTRGERFGDDVDGGLGGGVGDAGATAAVAGDGGDVDDRAFAGGAHVRRGGAAAVEDAAQVGAEDVVPDFVGDGIEVVVGDEVGHGAVVDEDLEGAELVDGGLDEALAVGVVAEIGPDGDGLAAAGADAFDDFVGGVGAAEVVDDDGCAELGEEFGGGAADA